MSENNIKVEENSRELFPGWQTGPIASKVAEFLQSRGYTSKHGVYTVGCESQEYKRVSTFIANMLDNLPFSNEVGETKLMRADAKKVVEEMSTVLRGKKGWDEIKWIFGKNVGNLEVFKNLVHYDHALTSAICYNVDLGLNLANQTYNYFVLDRFIVTPNNDRTVQVKSDGSFNVDRASMTIWTDSGYIGN